MLFYPALESNDGYSGCAANFHRWQAIRLDKAVDFRPANAQNPGDLWNSQQLELRWLHRGQRFSDCCLAFSHIIFSLSPVCLKNMHR
jgi:hypothetical protein